MEKQKLERLVKQRMEEWGKHFINKHALPQIMIGLTQDGRGEPIIATTMMEQLDSMLDILEDLVREVKRKILQRDN